MPATPAASMSCSRTMPKYCSVTPAPIVSQSVARQASVGATSMVTMSTSVEL